MKNSQDFAMQGVSIKLKSHLMGLPTEIRLEVLRLCLPTSLTLIPCGPKPHGFHLSTDRYPWSGHTTVSILPILLLNKRIFEEASQIIYGENRFLFPDPGASHKFLNQIGRLNSYHLRQIRIWKENIERRPPMPFTKLMDADAVNLRKLIIPPWHLMFPNTSLTGKEMARNLCGRAIPMIRHLYQTQQHRKRIEIAQIIEVADAYCHTCQTYMVKGRRNAYRMQGSAPICPDSVHQRSVEASNELRQRLLSYLRKPWNKRRVVATADP